MITRDGREAWRSVLGLFYPRVQTQLNAAASVAGVSPGALRALMLIEPGQGVAMGELAERWGCDASYITNLADDLEARGLVRREPKPSDRRARLLVLTALGITTRQRAHEMFTEPPPALGALTAEEQRVLRRLLARMTAGEAAPVFRAR